MVFLRLTVKVYPRNPNAPRTGSPASFLLPVENPEDTSLGGLASLIQEKWKKLRPHEGALEIKQIVDDAHESADLDPDMTVADVWVDLGKARSDNCDQRGTVRVIQKPTDEPYAPVRFPSVTHDWDAAAQEFQRQRRVKNEPASPPMGTIPEEGSQPEAEDSGSEESGSEEESGGEEETGSEEEAEEAEETESESDSVEEVAGPGTRKEATLDAEPEIKEETDDEEGSEEGGADVEPVAQAKTDQEQGEETDDGDEESDNEEDKDEDEDEDKEESEEEEEPNEVIDNAAKDAEPDEEETGDEETGDEDDSGGEESEESERGEEPNDEMEVDEEEEVYEAPRSSRLKRARDADEFQEPSKQPRLDQAGSRAQENGEPSPEKRLQSTSGLGLGITKSPPSKKPAMITPSTPAIRRGPLFQTNGTPSATLTPNTASRLPSALRKESPTQRSAVRRSVSFADEDDVVDEWANKPKYTPQSTRKQANQDSISSKSARSQQPSPAGAAADTGGDEAAQNQEAMRKLEEDIEAATKKGQTGLAQHMKKILKHRIVLSHNVGTKVKRNMERAQRARDNVADLEKQLVEIQARSTSSTSTPASKKVEVVVPATAATNGDKSKSVERDATPGPTCAFQMKAASEGELAYLPGQIS